CGKCSCSTAWRANRSRTCLRRERMPHRMRRMQHRRKQGNNQLMYEIIIYWSKADGAFIAEVPELPGCAADGATDQEALEAAQGVMQEWMETAKERGRPIPEPRGRLLYA